MNETLIDAQKAFDNNKYNEALELFIRVQGDKKENSIALQGIVKCLYRLNREEEAIAKCIGVIANEPNNPLMHALLADLYASIGDLKKSREEADLAYALDPNSPEVLGCYGTQMLQEKRTDEAIPILEKAVLIDDSLYYVHRNLLAAYFEKKDNKKVIEKLKKIYSMHPSFRWGFGLFIAYMNKYHLFPIIGILFFLTFIGYFAYHSWSLLLISLVCIVFILVSGIFVKKYSK